MSFCKEKKKGLALRQHCVPTLELGGCEKTESYQQGGIGAMWYILLA